MSTIKNKKLITVGVGLLLSVGYAIYSITAYNASEKAATEQRARDQHTYLSKADMEELLRTPPDNADYVMEVYVGEGGYYQWHTQRLFIMRYKPVYTLFKKHKVGFRILMGDTNRAKESGNNAYGKDAEEIKRIGAIPPLEYKIFTKDGNVIFHSRGSIPTKDATAILEHAFNTIAKAKDGAPKEVRFYDYVKINQERLKAMRKKMEEKAQARYKARQGMHRVPQPAEAEQSNTAKPAVPETLNEVKNTPPAEPKQTQQTNTLFTPTAMPKKAVNNEKTAEPQVRKNNSTLF